MSERKDILTDDYAAADRGAAALLCGEADSASD